MTRFHFAGRYDDDPESLITHEHEPGYVPFREIKSMKTLGIVMNGIALLIAVICFGLYFYIARKPLEISGLIIFLASLIPHEFLHAICFSGDVYMYENLKRGMLFVAGPGTFSKAGFVFMSMLPNLVFGFIPFALFLIDPDLTVLGTLGAAAISSGAGDYYNVFNALTQMPKGSRTYLHGTSSYWYMPKDGIGK
ncbi:MAG: DUF3267 domain-containing protein [Erysipelotrichaceae bacterium]|jgi:hypothetical protein|nr:DUF3267 domain-containing protein [Erysipelotrichaceae bacterium]